MRRVLTRVVLACAAVWPLAAHALFDDDEARRRIELLRSQVAENQRLVDEQLKRLDAAMSQATDRGALLQISSQLEGLTAEMAKMRGQLEVLANQAEVAERKQKDLYLDIDTRLRKLETPREAIGTDKPAAETDPGEAKAYQAALDQFKLGNYALAVAAMQSFLATYPSSKLAPNAQYWVGMAHSGQRDYKAAIAAQRKLLAAWPDSEKAPDAMLSIASAQETMGDRAAARKTLEELVAKYPQSSSANSAKQRLAASKR